MPRIPYSEPGSEHDEATPVYQEIEKSMGRVPNLLKLVGHSGAATRGLGTLLRIHFGELSIPARIRELAYLTAARHNGCDYCQAHHEPLARQAGLSKDQIAQLGPAGIAEDDAELSEEERAVARFSWETSRDVRASDEAVEALKRHFGPAEIAEIAFVVASANFIQRIGRNLDVEVED